MKKSVALLLAVVVMFFVFPDYGEAQRIHREPSGGFQYIEPAGWLRVPPRRTKYSFLLGQTAEGKPVNRNIQFEDIGAGEGVKQLSEKYLEKFKTALPDYRLIDKTRYVNRAGLEVVKVIQTNTLPGVAVRQSSFFIGSGRARLLVTCTVLAEDGDRYDDVFRFLIDSIRFY